MSITIIECKEDLITLSNFIKKNELISINKQIEKVLECPSNEWIYYAGIAIKELINKSNSNYPITIILPEFAVLTKSIKVPCVSSSKTKYIIHMHIAQFLGISEKECLGFVVKSSNEIEMEVICSLVKKDWIESFCKAIELVGDKIESIQSPSIHYYNAFNLHFPTSKNILLMVFHGLSISCVFINHESVFFIKLQLNNNDFNPSVKELLEFYKTKNSTNIINEVFISGLSCDSDELIDSLSNYIDIPVKFFSPLSKETNVLGSTGFVYSRWIGSDLFINLMPTSISKRWTFSRSKKAFFICGACIFAACGLLLATIIYQKKHYDNLIQIYQKKIDPLRKAASIINHNEEKIKLYEEGLNVLKSERNSNYSWVNLLNALQSILTKIPEVQIHSLAVVNSKDKDIIEDSWKDSMMGTEKMQKWSDSRLLNLSGIVKVDSSNKSSNEIIDDLKYLILQLAKLNFIENTKNFYFDIESYPVVPFSFSLILKAQAL